MRVPDASALIERVRSLPAAGPLLDRFAEFDGVYLVGGAVRDLLLGDAPMDLDLVVEGDPAALAASLGCVAREHERFGTSTVVIDGRTYDIAQTRRECYPRPGALPEVTPASLREDLPRRDFTVNAMAIALGGPRPGELISVPHALEDLGARRLRVLHERSFTDDPTRLLRLARYASRLGFGVEPGTEELARAALASEALQTVSGERIGAELRLLAREPDPVAAFETARALGVQRLAGFDAALARRALALLPPDGRADELVIAALASGLLEPLAEALARASAPSEIARVVQDAPAEAVALAGAMGPAEQARAWLDRLRHLRLEIDGRDLLAAGVPEGPGLGAGLRRAYDAKLDGRASGREQELAEALRAVGETDSPR